MATEEHLRQLEELAGPNPELYERLSQKVSDPDVADERIIAFFRDLKRIREQHGIPELLVVCGVHHEPVEGSNTNIVVRVGAYGDPDMPATLGAVAFNTFTLPEIERGEKLSRVAGGAGRKVVTK